MRLASAEGLSPEQMPRRIRLTDRYRPPAEAVAFVKLKARLLPPARAALPGGYDFARDAYFAELGAVPGALLFATFCASAATASFMAYDFIELSPYVLIGNPLTLAIIEFFAIPGALIGAVLYPLGLDALVWQYVGLGIGLILWAARLIASARRDRASQNLCALCADLPLARSLVRGDLAHRFAARDGDSTSDHRALGCGARAGLRHRDRRDRRIRRGAHRRRAADRARRPPQRFRQRAMAARRRRSACAESRAQRGAVRWVRLQR